MSVVEGPNADFPRLLAHSQTLVDRLPAAFRARLLPPSRDGDDGSAAAPASRPWEGTQRWSTARAGRQAPIRSRPPLPHPSSCSQRNLYVPRRRRRHLGHPDRPPDFPSRSTGGSRPIGGDVRHLPYSPLTDRRKEPGAEEGQTVTSEIFEGGLVGGARGERCPDPNAAKL